MAHVFYVKQFKAIVVASDRTMAFNYLRRELRLVKKFNLDFKDINPNDFIQLDTRLTHVVLLDDGEVK